MTNPSFDKDYVISLTLRHMRNNIDLSISKTIGRVAEFENDNAKSMEVMQTLSALHGMKRDVDGLISKIASKSNVSS